VARKAYTRRLYSGTAGATGNTQSTPIPCKTEQEGVFYLKITAATGSSPTLDLVIQTYNPMTETWHTLATFDQKTTTGQDEGFVQYGLGEKIACIYTIGGTTPSFTFTVDVTLK